MTNEKRTPLTIEDTSTGSGHEFVDPLTVKATIAENLKRLRWEKGWSQELLGRLADLHATEISRLERGLREPRVVTIAKVARALQVSITELMVDPVVPRPAVRQVVQRARVLYAPEWTPSQATLDADQGHAARSPWVDIGIAIIGVESWTTGRLREVIMETRSPAYIVSLVFSELVDPAGLPWSVGDSFALALVAKDGEGVRISTYRSITLAARIGNAVGLVVEGAR